MGAGASSCLPAKPAVRFELSIKATNRIVVDDILVGDVWVASGQSNMEFPMTALANADTEIAAAQYPKIRLLLVKHKPADYPQEDVDSKTWTHALRRRSLTPPRWRISLRAISSRGWACRSA